MLGFCSPSLLGIMLKRATKLGFGFVVYSAGVFLAYDWYQNRIVGNRPLISGTVDESERIRLFTEIASRYDSLVGAEEKLTNTTDLRRKLVEHCSGEVLEVASGTGRNLQYYSSAVQRLTLVDTSEAMTKTAARKWADLQEQSHSPLTAVQCITADAIKVRSPPLLKRRRSRDVNSQMIYLISTVAF